MINRVLRMALRQISSCIHLMGQLHSRMFRLTRRHRVYMSFTRHANGWCCRFHKDDIAKTPISRLFVFRDAGKLYEAGLRGHAFISTESRQARKRPEFPTSMSLGARPSIRSWVLQRKRDLCDRFAGGGRFQRSGALSS